MGPLLEQSATFPQSGLVVSSTPPARGSNRRWGPDYRFRQRGKTPRRHRRGTLHRSDFATLREVKERFCNATRGDPGYVAEQRTGFAPDPALSRRWDCWPMVVMKKSHASQFSSRSSISALAQQANQVTFPRLIMGVSSFTQAPLVGAFFSTRGALWRALPEVCRGTSARRLRFE